jgi:hypothetical protein
MLAVPLKNEGITAILDNPAIKSLAAQCGQQSLIKTEIYQAYAVFADNVTAAMALANKKDRANALNAIRLSHAHMRMDIQQEIQELDTSHTDMIKTFGASAWVSTRHRRRYAATTRNIALVSATLAAGMIATRTATLGAPFLLAAAWTGQRMAQILRKQKSDNARLRKTFAVTADVNKEIAARRLNLAIAEGLMEHFGDVHWPTSPRAGNAPKPVAGDTENLAPKRGNGENVIYPSFPHG